MWDARIECLILVYKEKVCVFSGAESFGPSKKVVGIFSSCSLLDRIAGLHLTNIYLVALCFQPEQSVLAG